MPTTVVPITGGSFAGNDGKNILRTQFTTVDATPNVFDLQVVDPPLGAVHQCFFVKTKWTAVSGASISAGESVAAFFDNGAITLLIGSAAPLAAGSATLTVGTTGGRSSQFSFLGINATSLQWTVIFEVTPMAAE